MVKAEPLQPGGSFICIPVCSCSNHSVEYLFSPALTFSSLFNAEEYQQTEFLWTVFNYSVYLNAIMLLF